MEGKVGFGPHVMSARPACCRAACALPGAVLRATCKFEPPGPSFVRPAEEILRTTDEAGDRVHDPGACQFAICLSVGIIDVAAAALDAEAQQREGGIGQSNGLHDGSLLRDHRT